MVRTNHLEYLVTQNLCNRASDHVARVDAQPVFIGVIREAVDIVVPDFGDQTGHVVCNRTQAKLAFKNA